MEAGYHWQRQLCHRFCSHRSPCSVQARPSIREETRAAESSKFYVGSTTSAIRILCLQFLDPLPFMIPAFPIVLLPQKDQRVVDDLFVLLSLKVISNSSTSTPPPTRWIISRLSLWSSGTQSADYSIHPTYPPLHALHSVGFTLGKLFRRLAKAGGQIASLTPQTSLWTSLGTG